MQRAFYSSDIQLFLRQHENTILGELTRNNPFSLEDLQRNAWLEEIRILKRALAEIGRGHIVFEYTIPRIGHRIDGVYIVDGIVFLLEFKVGSREYARHAMDQVTDYALDLKNFHKTSHNLLLVPMLIATRALVHPFANHEMKPGIWETIKCNQDNIADAIRYILSINNAIPLDASEWMSSPYAPTPTIIEAAQALYRGHNVTDISRNDASAVNLNQTTAAINEIIEKSKHEHKKSICFITGVPGAGKTLAGLNIANERHKFDESEHAVFLSGNQPLVDVLQEALARDEHERLGVKKSEAKTKAKAFIQIIHHFRDDAISTSEAPTEKVAIFDEAQRAWTEDMLSDFMARKKGKPNFLMSEPEFLISIMDRHSDWAVIICLIGGGQEINTGEAGLIEWFNSLRNDFPNWDVYVSDKITDTEYTRGLSMDALLGGLKYTVVETLHLAVSLRSFRSENVAGFVKAVLDVDCDTAKTLYSNLHQDYPILITRNLDKAKEWIQSQAKGTERYGVTASSGAKRLRGYGVWVQSKIDATTWFLNDANDVRSSYFLEDTATEFDIQGLELDWTIVCWDANLRFVRDHFEHYSFTGSKWMNINKPENVLYLKNAYRVLLTRARQGMIIFIPHGSNSDPTRPHNYYDGTYHYLKEIGMMEI
ncbi:DUF2075 domain-containing protein [Ruminococcaceae bacterium OttesenSCG-928-O06]|nr:DUF2075 domain-containing protein [Ruminococcaceae bacterium OttesenSCG-928-O06]